MEGAPKKSSKIEKAIRSTLAGAAFLGAVGGAEVPKGGGMPQMQSAEAQESFSFEAETKAFLDKIESMDVGIDDARGRHTLRAKIQGAFDTFALACGQRTPYYSATRQPTLGGSIDAEMRDAAKRYLLPRLMVRHSNSSLQALQSILSGVRTAPQATESESRPNVTQKTPPSGGMPSEIRRSPTYEKGNW